VGTETTAKAKVVALLILLVVLATSVFVALKSPDTNAPRFRKIGAPTSANQISYDFLSSRPFEGGKMWVLASPGGTNRPAFLYDIEHRRVFGEVINGWPEMLLTDPPRLVCSQSSPVLPWDGLKGRFLGFVARISGGRINLQPPASTGQRHWLLELDSNSATWLGDIPGTPNFSLFRSPDSHYCFTLRHGRRSEPDFYLMDLQKRLTRRLIMPASPCEWWDNTHILLRSTNCDFLLYDVRNRAVSPLIAFGNIAAFFKAEKLLDNPKQAQAFAIFNGQENDFYLTDLHQKWLAAESFLINLERPDGRLKLVSPRFKFEWSDHLDSTGQRYLYTGRTGGNASDGVFLRELDSGTNRVLVAPTTDKYFSIPRFYRDSVIYIRSNALWQISLDGSNNERLFPPLGAQAENPGPDGSQTPH
jgi:hypothetical protein